MNFNPTRRLSIFFNAFALSNTFLKGNKLRSMLSILGIAIGIFCIVAVLTFASSMKRNVKQNLETLGLNVIFIEKWPWGFGGGEYRWWDFMARPESGLKDYRLISQRASPEIVQEIGFECSAQGLTVKFGKISTTKSRVMGVTAAYARMTGIDIKEGRMFNEKEAASGKNFAILGSQVAEEFFPEGNPIGKTIRIKGLKTMVIGVFQKQGSMMNKQVDAGIYIPIGYMRNFLSIGHGTSNSRIVVKGFENRSTDELESEVRKLMRGIRMLKPSEKDNFALNKMTMFSNQLDSTFITLDAVAWILGLFSLIVGMFGIANIMFVSVKERTPVIGVQKALGAKNSFILVQFLYESVVLSIAGGMAGIALVWLVSLSISSAADFPIFFSLDNFITGLSLSVITGIVAGIIPAIRASRLNPVEAIRS